MGTNIYMRKIPTAQQKKELKELLKKQYTQTIEAIDRDDELHPFREDWELADDIDTMQKSIYEEVHIGKCSMGWKFLFAPNPQHYAETRESILEFLHKDGWQLFDEYGEKVDPDLFWDEYVTSHEDGWTGAGYDKWEREQGHYGYVRSADFEHITPEGLRFARDSEFS